MLESLIESINSVLEVIDDEFDDMIAESYKQPVDREELVEAIEEAVEEWIKERKGWK